jgi:PAS domain-containing protein
MREPADPVTASAPEWERLDAALAGVVRDTGASAGLVFLLEPGGRMLRLTVLTGASTGIAAPWTRLPLSAPLPVADAVRERRLLWLGSQEEVARRYPRLGLVLPYDFVLATAPLLSDTTAWGALSLLWPASHSSQLAPEEREAVWDCCRRTGMLLRQAADDGHPILPGPQPRVLPQRRSVPGPTMAMEAAEFIDRLPGGCCSMDLEGRITFVTPSAADLVGASVGALTGSRPWEILPWLNDPVFEDRYRDALVSREPTSFVALRPPDRWLSFQLYPNSSGISLHITPVSPAQAPDGDVAERPPSDFTQSRVGVQYRLMHLAATLTEAVGVQDVVELVGDQVVPAFGPQALALMTAEEGRLHTIGYRGYTAELVERFDAAPLGSDTPAARTLSTGVPLFFATFAELKRAHPPAVDQDGMASWAFLPLIVSGRTVGSLVLAYERPHSFAPAERAVLTSLAGLIAQALDRASLYDAKHELAHTLQTGLLPRTLPGIPGLNVAARYFPATRGMDIGGDFYDLIRCDEATAAAAIGDVQGHNVKAAALMGQVRTAVHAHAATGVPPGEVLARTNRLLIDLDPGLFTSCLYAHLDLPRHRARLATAGHPPPLLRHPDGRTEVLQMPPGLLLGIDPTTDYPTTDVPFLPGTLIALYTDGLVETPGTSLDDALVDLAERVTQARDEPMHALADAIIDHAAQDSPRNDDIALLLIEAAADAPEPPA